MTSSSPLSNIQVDVACGGALCETVEGRRYLQRRLALFGSLGFLFSFGVFVALNLLLWFFDGRPLSFCFEDRANQVHIGCCVVFLVVRQVCRGPLLSSPLQVFVDTAGVLMVGVTIGMTYERATLERFADHHGVVALAVTLFARSFIVPSSAPRTFAIGILAAVPVVTGYWLGMREIERAGGHVGPSLELSTGLNALWCFVAVATSTVSSRILYGLESEVREAKQLGQYTLENRIGRGGMGEVYRARHALLRRPTAVKLLRPDQAGERNLARFEREVQITSLLTHPNTIAIWDYGRTPDGVFYYAMEYLDGLNLEELVRRAGPLPASRVIHILDQACGSLIEAHEACLIHRDIKPANIFVCNRGGVRDFVKVLDFGLVKDLGPTPITGPDGTGAALVSAANTITGSPMYLAPEAIRSPGDVDARTDLYALGAVGYFLATGHHLFEDDNVMEIIGHHLHTEPVRPSARAGALVPGDLENLILHCLEKSPSQRPQRVQVLRERLTACRDAGDWSQADAKRWWDEHSDAPPVETSATAETIDASDPGLGGPPPGADLTSH